MRLIYPDVGECRSLVIDANPASRSLLAAMLRDMGVVHITQTSRVAEARRMLESRSFDIVLCDYHFDNSPMSGRDLLDDLRRTNALPYATVFVMVTGEASYLCVAEAAESALDSYLLRPHTAAALAQRLIQARHRKRVLGPVFDAVEAGDLAHAAGLCRTRFATNGEYALYAARIGAELYLRIGEHAAARGLYEAVQKTKPAPWAALGIARVEYESSQLREAQATLETLTVEHPDYADAFDVLGRVHAELGEFERALATCRQACALTPQNVARVQHLGQLAYSCGQVEDASQALQRAVRIGLGSKMFDAQNLVMLACMQYDATDSKALRQTADRLARLGQRGPQGPRERRLALVVNALKSLLCGATEAGTCEIGDLAAEISKPDFDFEAAHHLLAVLVRAHSAAWALPHADAWVSAIARRFCVSRASADILCNAVRHEAAFATAIREAQADIGALAEQAMGYSIQGDPDRAVKSLVASGSTTLNAKLIELAALVLAQNASIVAEHDALASRIAALKRRYCADGVRTRLSAAAGRAVGGLHIRAGHRRKASDQGAPVISRLSPVR